MRYEPSYETPDGVELVAVFISASTCVANSVPGFTAAIDSLNRSLARRAAAAGMHYAAVGVATDWMPDSGFAYLRRLSAFDEVIVGRNWYNTAISHHVWRTSGGRPVEPQVILLQRRVVPGEERVAITPDQVLRRIFGADSLLSWVAQGTPLP